MTKTLATEKRDELGALALREAADRLARRDPALVEDPVCLHAPVLRDREDHVEGLRRVDVFGRVEEKRLDLHLPGLEVALQLRALAADLVRTPQSPHPLVVGPLGNAGGCLDGGRGHRRARVYPRPIEAQGNSAVFRPNSSRPQLEVESRPLRRSAGEANPRSASSLASSSLTRTAASGSRKLAVPTATALAPATIS